MNYQQKFNPKNHLISQNKNGNIKGYEPKKEMCIESPIGKIKVFDPDPNGMLAENHSLCFHGDGGIQSIITSSSKITAYKDGVEYKNFAPQVVPSYCNENAFFILPLKISFDNNKVNFSNVNQTNDLLPIYLQYKIADFVPEQPVSEVGC